MENWSCPSGDDKQPTLLIDDRDRVGFQVGNAGGHEVHNGLDLLLLEASTLFELQEYGRARALVIANECGWPRHCEVHAGALDGPQGRDGARQLGLESMLVAGVLHELTDPEAGVLVHHGEAAAAFGQPLARELQSRVIQLLGGYFDRVGARSHAIGNLGRIQCLSDLCLVLRAEVCIQRGVGGTARPQHDGHARGHCHGNAHEQQ